MARTLRVQYPGAIYHVMSRGDRREDTFYDPYRIAASGRGASRSGTTESKRTGAVGVGGTIASRNDFDDPGDCAAAAFGQLDECRHPTPEPETNGQTTWEYVIVIVGPLFLFTFYEASYCTLTR